MKLLYGLIDYLLKIWIKRAVEYFNKWRERKEEQSNRHGDNSGSIEKYKAATGEDVKDSFGRLP